MRNNTLDALYCFERTTGKTRFDCVASTKNYLHFEQFLLNKIGFNKGGLSIQLTPRPTEWNDRGHSGDQAISKAKNVSTLFLLDIKQPTVFYGDPKGTKDALVIQLEKDDTGTVMKFSIFIAKGHRNIKSDVCFEFLNGGLSTEIEALRADLQPFVLPTLPT